VQIDGHAVAGHAAMALSRRQKLTSLLGRFRCDAGQYMLAKLEARPSYRT